MFRAEAFRAGARRGKLAALPSAYQHFAAALKKSPDPRTAELAEQGIAAIQSMQKYRVGRPRGRGL